MATNGYESWAVDLANVTAVYPFQGYELLMVLLGVAFWLFWHVAQFNMECEEYADAAAHPASKEEKLEAIDRY